MKTTHSQVLAIFKQQNEICYTQLVSKVHKVR